MSYNELVSWEYIPAYAFLKNDKEILKKIYLIDPEQEKIVENGLLPMNTSFSPTEYPYFRVEKIRGYTRRARSYGELKMNMLKRYPELKGRMQYIKKKIFPFGDFIFLDLAFIDNMVNPLVKKEDGWFNKNFVEKDKFTPDFVQNLVDYVPLTLIERKPIKEYQEREIPLFLSELKLSFPEIYKEIQSDVKISYIGRKAFLKTLNPGEVCFCERPLGERKFYNYDGETLISIEKKENYTMSTKIIPTTDRLIVEVRDDKTVNPNTKFVD